MGLANSFNLVKGYVPSDRVKGRRKKKALEIGFSEREAVLLAEGAQGLRYTPQFWKILKRIRRRELEAYSRTHVGVSWRDAAEVVGKAHNYEILEWYLEEELQWNQDVS